MSWPEFFKLEPSGLPSCEVVARVCPVQKKGKMTALVVKVVKVYRTLLIIIINNIII